MILRDVPLFPLNTVLFPQMLLPLQIFEPRYRIMINECLRDNKPFGVILIEGNFPDAKEDSMGNPINEAIPGLYRVGTLAKITEVTRLEDGRLIISTVGTERFKLLDYYEVKPYMTGDIEIWPDGDIDASTPVVTQLVSGVIEIFQKYLEVLMNLAHKRIEGLDIPEDPATLSYLIPHWLIQISMEDKQQLLEAADPNLRLEQELSVLNNETEFLNKIMERAEELAVDEDETDTTEYNYNLQKRFSQN
jgi:Lon protease-like protein